MSTLRMAQFADTFPERMRAGVEALVSNLTVKSADYLEKSFVIPRDTGVLIGSQKRISGKSGIRIKWDAQRAIGIDIGRVMSKPIARALPHKPKHYKRGKLVKTRTRPFRRLLGSAQAPEGFTRPAIAKLRQAWDEVAASAGKSLE